MDSRLDRALELLKYLEDSLPHMPEETQMYYHLLCIQAKDKQYITHTDDSLISCIVKFYENRDDADWMYGEQQELANTEWKSTKVYYVAGTQGRSVTDITDRAETLRFDSNSFTFTDTRMDYTTQKEVTVQATGTYEYKHPRLKLVFEDGAVLEASISVQNTIYYNDEKMGYNEFELQQ